MKKVLFAVAIVAALGFSVTSCKCEAKKEAEEVTTVVTENGKEHNEDKEHNEEVEHHDMAKATYQCPMKCEKDKTYDAPGQCPTCKMDLKEVEGDIEKEDHQEEDHDHDHGSEGDKG